MGPALKKQLEGGDEDGVRVVAAGDIFQSGASTHEVARPAPLVADLVDVGIDLVGDQRDRPVHRAQRVVVSPYVVVGARQLRKALGRFRIQLDGLLEFLDCLLEPPESPENKAGGGRDVGVVGAHRLHLAENPERLLVVALAVVVNVPEGELGFRKARRDLEGPLGGPLCLGNPIGAERAGEPVALGHGMGEGSVRLGEGWVELGCAPEHLHRGTEGALRLVGVVKTLQAAQISLVGIQIPGRPRREDGAL